MPKDIEILPPIRTTVAQPKPISVSVPTLYRGGPISSKIDAWVWNSRATAIDALTRVNASEVALAGQQTALVHKKRELDDALFEAGDAVRQRAHTLTLRTIQRADEIRDGQHRFEMNEYARREAVTHAEARLTQARTALVKVRTAYKDAERELLNSNQAYAAQEKYGETTHIINHKKQQHELLELRIDEAAARKLLRKLNREEPDPEEILDELYARRDQFLASGRDTSRIDREIARYENDEAAEG